LAGAAEAIHAVYPDAKLPSLDQETSALTVPPAVRDLLLGTDDDLPWELAPFRIVQDSLYAGRPISKTLDMLIPFRRLGAPVPLIDEETRTSLDAVELDKYDLDMLAQDEAYGHRRAALRTISALNLVQIAGRFGWTLAHAHWRLSRLVPIGLTL